MRRRGMRWMGSGGRRPCRDMVVVSLIDEFAGRTRYSVGRCNTSKSTVKDFPVCVPTTWCRLRGREAAFWCPSLLQFIRLRKRRASGAVPEGQGTRCAFRKVEARGVDAVLQSKSTHLSQRCNVAVNERMQKLVARDRVIYNDRRGKR